MISFAVLAVSAAAIIAVNANNRMDEQIVANVEALAEGEPTLMGYCEKQEGECMATCKVCNRWFYAPGYKGGSYNMNWVCSDCAR